MDKSVNHILSKLKVLSKLQSGQKLMIEDLRISIMECDKNNWDRFVKWWLGETRHSTLDKLQGFYLEIRDTITSLSAHPKDNFTALSRISHELSCAMRGLSNLMLTYQGDRTIVSHLETLYENFNYEVKRVKDQVEKIKKEMDTTIQKDNKSNKQPNTPPPPPGYNIKLSVSESTNSSSGDENDESFS